MSHKSSRMIRCQLRNCFQNLLKQTSRMVDFSRFENVAMLRIAETNADSTLFASLFNLNVSLREKPKQYQQIKSHNSSRMMRCQLQNYVVEFTLKHQEWMNF